MLKDVLFNQYGNKSEEQIGEEIMKQLSTQQLDDLVNQYQIAI